MNVPLKKCAYCPRSFPATLEFFYAHKQQKDGLQPRCKECFGKGRQSKPEIPEGYARCFACNEVMLDIRENFLQNRPTYRKSTMCVNCMQSKRDRAKEREKLGLEKHRPDTKKCKICDHPFPFTDEFFYEDDKMPFGLSFRCKTCINKIEQEFEESAIEEDLKDWKHRLFMKVIIQNMRYELVGVPGRGLTNQSVQYMYFAQEFRCFYCFNILKSNFQVDHVHPISKGGRHDPENCVLVCQRCNLSKGAKDLDDWLEYLIVNIFKLKQKMTPRTSRS